MYRISPALRNAYNLGWITDRELEILAKEKPETYSGSSFEIERKEFSNEQEHSSKVA